MSSIPKKEIQWESIYNDEHQLSYVITSNQSRDTYYAYKVEYTKLGQSKDPMAAEKKFCKGKG